jgi:membrane protease YdiL (CAAX protease family)
MPDHTDAPHTPPLEALAIALICFGYFILGSIGALSSGFAGQSFSDSGFSSLIALELILASVAMAVLHARRYPLQTLWPRASWRGLGTAALLYLFIVMCSTVIGAALHGPEAQPVDRMLSEARISLSTILPLALINGPYEEVFLLAFFQRGLRRFGASNAIGFTVLLRMLYHMYQGPVGAAQVAAYGMVVGIYYWRTGRLFPVIAVHVAADIIPFL